MHVLLWLLGRVVVMRLRGMQGTKHGPKHFQLCKTCMGLETRMASYLALYPGLHSQLFSQPCQKPCFLPRLRKKSCERRPGYEATPYQGSALKRHCTAIKSLPPLGLNVSTVIPVFSEINDWGR